MIVNNQRPVGSFYEGPIMRSFYISFLCYLNKLLNKESIYLWFEAPWCSCGWSCKFSLHSRHNGRDGVSNNRCLDCLLDHLFSRRSKKTPKLCVISLCEGNSPVTCEFPAHRASNAENVFIWWRHYASPGSDPTFSFTICTLHTVLFWLSTFCSDGSTSCVASNCNKQS